MIQFILMAILSGLCLNVALCGLLTDRMKYGYYASMLFVSISLSVVSFVINAGQVMTIVTMTISMILIITGEKTHPILNFCLACIGYTFNVALNEIILLAMDKVLHISTIEIIENYYLLFSSSYLLIEIIVFYLVRYFIYNVLKIQLLFGRKSKIKFGLVANLISFLVIVIANVILGEKVGYSQSALIMNTVLFGICFVINTIVLFYCVRQIQAEEYLKMNEAKAIMTQNYVDGLEHMIDESRTIRHDYKNILSTMSGYLQEDNYTELKKYFESNIRDFWVAADKQGKIWNALSEVQPIELKGFLYEKALKASASEVDFRVLVEQGIVLKYHDMENLIRVFGNLLDNAIEAATETENKYVTLRISGSPKGVYFIIHNPFKQQPDLERMFEDGYTTKGDGHGSGLYFVNEYLKKNPDIYYMFSIENNEFVQSLEIENK